ncbi:lymphocyte antigen 75-like [Cynoglossus semilaevis]|uniref:lymphocyte antigen 75-like n=1 Tax=Cynoglossus semilaevis TaxID=244447 RepID=UPI000496C1C2|nr:lymphocyte antigen 75-like [Cynoglossus semilaevis]
MDQMMAFVLFLLSSAWTKYVSVSQRSSWPEAQTNCRQQYTDLAVISNVQDNEEVLKIAAQLGGRAWIGINWNNTDSVWMWSGGGRVSTFFWGSDQPEYNNQIYGMIYGGSWHDSNDNQEMRSICFHAIVVKEKKTWLEALEYCRGNHSDLASVASETELLLIQKEMKKNAVTEAVWIGLHFFPEGWLWVDGRPLDYEVWLHDNRPVCPQVFMECAALNTTENQLRTGAVDCEERLYFLCY